MSPRATSASMTGASTAARSAFRPPFASTARKSAGAYAGRPCRPALCRGVSPLCRGDPPSALHSRERWIAAPRCRECSDPQHSDFCPHDRRKGQCKECGGSQICKVCGGPNPCARGRLERPSRSPTCLIQLAGSVQHNRQKFRCKDCFMCPHYRVKSRCAECIADEMKNVVLSYPRGQAWNMKRPTLEADAENAAAAALARAGGAGSPTNRGASKDVCPDPRGIKPAKSPEPADPAPSEPGLALITGDPAVAVLKVKGVLQEVPLGWEAERAHLKQQIEALRAAMRYCPVLHMLCRLVVCARRLWFVLCDQSRKERVSNLGGGCRLRLAQFECCRPHADECRFRETAS